MLTKLKTLIRGIIGRLHMQREGSVDLTEVTFSVLGRSVAGRAIQLYTFGTGAHKILYLGGIHGNEVGTIKLMQHWVKYLSTHPSCLPQDTQVFIIPCLSPDGYALAQKHPDYYNGGKIGKPNTNQVDLNRNFPTTTRSSEATMFIGGETLPISGGTSPGSEPEIQALVGLVAKEDIKTIYTYHSCWGTVMSSYTPRGDVLTQRYATHSGYRVFSEKERTQRGPEKMTGHFTIRCQEQAIDSVEIELKTRWSAERHRNKPALLDSLQID